MQMKPQLIIFHTFLGLVGCSTIPEAPKVTKPGLYNLPVEVEPGLILAEVESITYPSKYDHLPLPWFHPIHISYYADKKKHQMTIKKKGDSDNCLTYLGMQSYPEPEAAASIRRGEGYDGPIITKHLISTRNGTTIVISGDTLSPGQIAIQSRPKESGTP